MENPSSRQLEKNCTPRLYTLPSMPGKPCLATARFFGLGQEVRLESPVMLLAASRLPGSLQFTLREAGGSGVTVKRLTATNEQRRTSLDAQHLAAATLHPVLLSLCSEQKWAPTTLVLHNNLPDDPRWSS